ncbi:cyanophycin synthetase [Vreelandella boliviensis]|uniref:Cyanophycin synthetase n=1 Tax=Vreelandella boliviensis LC1 TaxID=1072583 RepID=A0A265E087_9GAMM|nr:cyanophycin synthetase [Halomonas boliviensis]EHJ91651.1 Cyanophycin synthetase [Halomonas boliviensis LC1]OZT74866.1 cyanophycin synthetase [Halomonas boliviensis LC1]
MNILEHRALRGPNYYSRYPVIFMRLDIEELEKRPSDTVPGIAARIIELLPSLYEHRCSIGRAGGFLERLERGTWAGHVVEHIAIELQNLIGFTVGYGKTVDSYETGIYNVVYRYRDEACGLAVGVEGVNIVAQLFNGDEIDISSVIARLKKVRDAHMLGPSTTSIVDAAVRRGIPWARLDADSSYIQLGHGCRQQRIQATVTCRTSLISHGIADDKYWTKHVLGEAGVPVPYGVICHSIEEALIAALDIGYPVVVKPLIGNHGRGVSTGISDEPALREAFTIASLHYSIVMVERFVKGEDYRLLVINGKLVAAARRRPAHVVGDGQASLQSLIDRENQDPRRGIGHENLLTQIHLDEQSHRLIAQQNLSLESVITKDQVVYLKSTANLSTGGTATDVTEDVHPEVKYTAERISRLVGLDIIGIDLLAETLTMPLEEQSAAVVEVNAGPGFRMHLSPTHGTGRDVGQHVTEMLFPDSEDSGRIPIAAVTGTNGKTTTVRLIAHLLRQVGRIVGTACTGAIEIDNHTIMRGDYSGPQAASTVLREPTVEYAVLEVARGGIMRRGLGFDECQVGVLLNIASDHLGENDIHTLDELARCKTVVIDAVSPEGTAVLNADDPRVLAGREWARGKVIYFSLDADSEPIRQHVQAHGIAFTVYNECIVMRQGNVEANIMPVVDAPITFEGYARFNVANVLAASAAAYALGLSIADIQLGLQTFHPTPGQNPGRTNFIDAGEIKVLIDYGHNVPALKALSELVSRIPAQRRISVASAPGNRRDEDLYSLGAQLASMHDIVLLYETDPRGRPAGEVVSLLRAGAESHPGSCRVEVIMKESHAVDRAFDEAREGDLLVLLVDDINSVTERLRGRRFLSDSTAGIQS